jgi:hypothetical protein
MSNSFSPQAPVCEFDADYIAIKGHDLQDILIRIGMPRAASRFQNLWVKVNPFVDSRSPEFLAEVWGLEENVQVEDALQCLYVAPKHTASN